MLQLALYHPQIPHNTGTLLRLCACWGVTLHLIKPLGFLFSDKRLKRAGMDYIEHASYKLHDSFDRFVEQHSKQRLIALDVHASDAWHHEFEYNPDDILVVGAEHYGFLEEDREQFDHFVKIPMNENCRSINMAISAAIVLNTALMQTKQFCM